MGFEWETVVPPHPAHSSLGGGEGENGGSIKLRPSPGDTAEAMVIGDRARIGKRGRKPVVSAFAPARTRRRVQWTSRDSIA